MTNNIETSQNDHDEIGIFDVFDFFLKNWLVIIVLSALGLIGAVANIMVTPVAYEATLQIAMARANTSSPSTPVANVEEAPLLVERLRLPSTYTQEAVQACELQDAESPLDALATLVKARPLKSSNSVAEINVRRRNPEIARACAGAIFSMIRQQQNDLRHPYLNETHEYIASLKRRLKENQDFLATMERTSVRSTVYLSKRDESLWLLDQIADLERLLRQTSETKLVSPIYSKPHPIEAKKLSKLALGIIAGLSLGVVLAFMRKLVSAWRGRKE